ncbi:MAG: AraC family transcriptional regulator, partial [Pseudomonadota bacterium]
EISGLETAGNRAPPSTFIFLPAGEAWEIAASRSGWSVQVAFDPALIGPAFANGHAKNGAAQNGAGRGDHHFTPQYHVEDDAMVTLAQQLSGLWVGEMPRPTERHVDAVAILLIHRLGLHLNHTASPPPRSSSVSRRIQDVLDHIERNLIAAHTLEDLAEVAGVSTYHFARMFRQVTGRSPHQYVVERRVAYAKRRLSNSDDPIVEIAHESGFSSQSHMTDVFSKMLGTTPGKVRRNAL